MILDTWADLYRGWAAHLEPGCNHPQRLARVAAPRTRLRGPARPARPDFIWPWAVTAAATIVLAGAGMAPQIAGGALPASPAGAGTMWIAREATSSSPASRGIGAGARTARTGLTASFEGRVVKYGVSGFEPDGDPIARVIIAGKLRHVHMGHSRLPDTMVVLSLYLENFQSATVPILPDLLHPNQTATDLGGFMQGKSALVNRAGRPAYNGGVLAEVFLDNSVHMVIDMQQTGAARQQQRRPQTVRVLSTFTLLNDAAHSVRGEFHSAHAFPTRELRATGRAVRTVTWQQVIGALAVHLPTQIGTAGNGSRGAFRQAGPVHATSRGAQAVPKTSSGSHGVTSSPPVVAVAVISGGITTLAVVATVLLRGRRRLPDDAGRRGETGAAG